MKLPIEYVEARDKKYILFKNDCGVTDMTRRGGVYEHYIFDYIKENLQVKGTKIIDIGANFGFHTLQFADLVSDSGEIHSFEPQRLVYYQLCGNTILNGLQNVFTYNIALSNESNILKMENLQYHSEHDINIGNAHLDACYDLAYNLVEVKTLDSYSFDNISVLKIDVQGYEPKVLDGAKETILKNKPTIFIEVEEPQLQIYNSTSKDIFDRLEALDYTYKKVINADHLVDYVATPK